MTNLTTLIDQPWAQALAWTLLHFVWQGALLALVAAVIFRAGRPAATTRYAIGVATLLAMLIAPIATFGVLLSAPVEPSSLVGIAPPAGLTGAPMPDGETVAPPAATPAAPVPIAPVVVVAWMLGVVVLSLRLLGGWFVARRLAHRAVEPAGVELQAMARRVAGRLALDRVVTVVQSSAVAVPVLVGWLRPVVLMPASALSGLTPTQIEALIAHELAHVRRHDYLVNLLQSAVETLLFYHPAVWWVSRQVRADREHCCDDLAVGVCDRVEYVSALANLAAMSTVPRTALAASGGSLLGRVRRLLGESSQPPSSTGWLAAFAVVFVVGAAVPVSMLSSDLEAEDGQRPAAGVAVAGVQGGVVGSGVATGVGTGGGVGVAGGQGVGVAGGVAGGVGTGVAGVETAVAGGVPTGVSGGVIAGTVAIAEQDAQEARRQQELRRAQLEAAQRLADVQREIELRRLELQHEQAQLESRAQLQAAEAEIVAVRKELERSRELVERGLMVPEQLLRTEAQLAEAQARLGVQRNQLQLREQELHLQQREVEERARYEQLLRELEMQHRVREVSPETERFLREQLADAQRRIEEARRGSRSEPAELSHQVEQLQNRLRMLDEHLVQSREQLALQEQTVTSTAGAAERLLMESWVMDAGTPARAGDVLMIQVADEPALPRAYRVDQEGRIRLPFVGQIRVQGLTAEQVQTEVSRQLVATNLKTNPSVTVSLRRPGGER